MYVINKLKYLEINEQQTLIQSLLARPCRDATILLLLLHTGARAQELLNVTSVDVQAGAIFLRGLKGSYDREIPLPEWLYALTRLEMMPGALPGAKVFDISYKRLYQVWCYWRPVKKKLHSLRHTFAINLYRKTKDLRLVSAALGHKNILNTMVYAHYVYTQDELRKALITIIPTALAIVS